MIPSKKSAPKRASNFSLPPHPARQIPLSPPIRRAPPSKRRHKPCSHNAASKKLIISVSHNFRPEMKVERVSYDSITPSAGTQASTSFQRFFSRNIPVAPSNRPVSPSNRPVTLSKRPVSPSNRPVAPSNRPVSPSNRPVTLSKRPVSPSKRPVSLSNEPISPGNLPVAPLSPKKQANQTPTP
jgi:hypothetical protein